MWPTPVEVAVQRTQCLSAYIPVQANRLLGMGSGQPNRVKSCEIALEKAGGEAKGAALASDAFFPFGE